MPDIRLVAAAHYIIARTDPSQLGATKLNKILWYSDLEHYRRHGTSITRLQNYIRMPNGPMAEGIEEALEFLKRNRSITERRARVYTYDRREFVWLKEPDVSLFSPNEIDIINQFILATKDCTAEFVSDVTHDALWKELLNGDKMSIRAGAVIPRAPSEKELEWAEAQMRE